MGSDITSRRLSRKDFLKMFLAAGTISVFSFFPHLTYFGKVSGSRHLPESSELEQDPFIISIAVSADQKSIRVTGRHFQGGDVAHIDGIPTETIVIGTTRINAKLLSNIGAGNHSCQILREGEISSNVKVFSIGVPVLKYGYHLNKFESGRSKIRVVGTGFQIAEIISIWSGETEIAPKSNIRVIDDRNLEFIATKHLEGDHIDIRILTESEHFSNDIRIKINTYFIVVFGDSVAWGQGLREDRKYYSNVAESIRERTNLSVVKEVYAHSGAIIGSESLPRRPGVGPEVPYDYPTILQQVNNYPGIAEQVDLVLIDGGINDVGLSKIASRKYAQSVRNDTSIVFSTAMPQLLNRVKSKFTNQHSNPKIVVLGYYQVISELTDLSVLEGFIIGVIGIALSIFLALLGLIGLNALRRHLSNNFEAFATTANLTMSRIIGEINMDPIGPRILFANPFFSSANALEAPDTFLWGVFERDDVRKEREDQCELARNSVSGIPIYCEIASTGHPNPRGAERYSNMILGQVFPKPPQPPNPCQPTINEINALRREIASLQSELREAPTGQKPAIVAMIRQLQVEIKKKEEELAICISRI